MASFDVLGDGTITSVPGIWAAGVHCGIKQSDALDLALIYSEVDAAAAATFTRNKVFSPTITVNRENLKSPTHRVIVDNSGNANTCTGERGLQDARRMAAWAAEAMGVKAEQVFVCSTGVIGRFLPMDCVARGIRQAAEMILRNPQSTIHNPIEGGHLAARAIMTTDTFPKEVAVQTEVGGKTVTVGGIAKGAGMIAPNMGTMHAFVATDCAIAKPVLKSMLRDSVQRSFNSITVDGDTSTSDTVIVLANGLAGNRPIENDGRSYNQFKVALDYVTQELAKMIARDGEGASHFITVVVKGAMTEEEAHRCGLTIANSPLVKTAVFGRDPNWGRIAAAAGRAGVRLRAEKMNVWLGEVQVMKNGGAAEFDFQRAQAVFDQKDITLTVDLGIGKARWTVWTCDFTYDYVKINAEYTT
ncbi:MAG: bifunctional glutamate N-acetyltransferase/amino-acid acetyltransferase ArgJ [Abditibacteriales bacterium]|nr:bifunctional glutamate N-acetyltransferase/amino-acid acetyltransferase ArgJ [Abditibacteriales bacterium]MDW8365177.1 bifunctional glutamate N-acetyltransferase/amino-acid acetyltransferase ArgJ [Abditibacteriales bacterium]